MLDNYHRLGHYRFIGGMEMDWIVRSDLLFDPAAWLEQT
uniref:Uncharacterized protein n=1 Tax=uncultured Methanosarcinales archaeon TaxID=183757 RepID=A0A7H1KNG1_9EURY|nr:hypothetical protein EKMJPAOO_00025 [uncultured Methanosarcinales archaeon]